MLTLFGIICRTMIGTFGGINEEAIHRLATPLSTPPASLNSRYGISSRWTRVSYRIGESLCRFSLAFDRAISQLCAQDIKGGIGLIIVEDKQEFLCHGWQFPFGAAARFAPARAGCDPFFIRFLLGCLVDVTEDGQQMSRIGLGTSRLRLSSDGRLGCADPSVGSLHGFF